MLPDVLACLGTALLLEVTAAGLVPRLAARWIPPGGRSWPTRVRVGATTAAAAGLLTWRHAPHHPGGYAVLAAWLTFATAGVMLAAIDIAVRRLPTPIIAVATTAVVLVLTVSAVLASRPGVVVMPLFAAITVGGVYVLLAAGDVLAAGTRGRPTATSSRPRAA